MTRIVNNFSRSTLQNKGGSGKHQNNINILFCDFGGSVGPVILLLKLPLPNNHHLSSLVELFVNSVEFKNR